MLVLGVSQGMWGVGLSSLVAAELCNLHVLAIQALQILGQLPTEERKTQPAGSTEVELREQQK